MERHTDPRLRHDFVLLFDVRDGNPNGDPDNGNLPRVDPETGEGLVSDVCLKRKVRDYVIERAGVEPPLPEERYGIYVQRREFLSRIRRQAFTALGERPGREDNRKVQRYLCEHYYDIRLFGGVLSAGRVSQAEAKEHGYDQNSLWSAGQVMGPVQLTFARSIGPVLPMALTITRVAVENPEDIERGARRRQVQEQEPEEARAGQMGAKTLLPYGLYRAYGFCSPARAAQTGVTAEDLALFWEALVQCWEHDRSASRGLMGCRGLYVFTHAHPLGDAPAHRLFEAVRVGRKYLDGPGRFFGDFEVSLDESAIPEGVHLVRGDAAFPKEGRAVALTQLAA